MFLTHWLRNSPRPHQKKTSNRFQPRLEVLDERLLPAVSIVQQGSMVLIIGDRAANVVYLVLDDENQLHVTADNGRTQTFTNVMFVRANLGAGDDQMTAEIYPPITTTPNDPHAPSFDLNVKLGVGNDRFDSKLTVPDEPDELAGAIKVSVFGEIGNDDISVRAGDANGAIPLIIESMAITTDGGSGQDVIDIAFDNSVIQENGRLSILANGGVGDDMLGIRCQNATVDGEFQLRVMGGDGQDSANLAIGGLSGTGSIAVSAQLGAGNDRFRSHLLPPPTPEAPAGSIAFTVDGAAGNDFIFIEAGEVNGTNPFVVSELAVNVTGGGGSDEVGIIIINSHVGSLTQKVNTGRGADEFVSIISNSEIETFSQKVDLGDADDAAAILNTSLTEGASLADTFAFIPQRFQGIRGLADMNESYRGFGRPVESFGDVKNLFGAGGGNDSIWLDIKAPVGLQNTMRGDTQIVLHGDAGNDRIEARVDGLTSEGDFGLEVNGGAGNDVVDVSFKAQKVANAVVGINTGAGDDKVTDFATGDFEHLMLDVNTGPGDDLLVTHFVETKAAHGRVHYDTGAGNDRVFAESAGNHLAFPIQLATGIGNDAVVGNVNQTVDKALGFLVDLGAGNDTAFLHFEMNLPMDQQIPVEMTVQVLGGAGDDSISVTTDLIAPLYTDSLEVTHYLLGSRFRLDLLVDAGPGSDILNVTGHYAVPQYLSIGYAGAIPRYVGEVHVDILGGASTDYLTVDWDALGSVQFAGVADGGTGIDACIATPIFSVINCEF